MTGPELSAWAAAQLEGGGWVRRMFAQGERLRAEHGADAVADVALGQPLGEPPARVQAAIEAAAAERWPGRHGYMPNLGFPEVRARLAADVDHPGMTSEQVIVTGGAGAAISLALRVLTDPGDEVVCAVPYFGEYRTYCAAAGLGFVAVPSRDDLGLDLGAVEAALGPRTAALVLNSPCNPSGHVTSGDELRGLAELLDAHARRRGRATLLIVDEVYHRILFPPAERVEPFAHHTATVLARSFSKDLGLAGERIGYLALHPEMTTREVLRGFEMAMRALGFVNAPATMQRMLLHLESLDVDLAPLQACRDHALRCARAADLEVADVQGGIYLWIRSPWRDPMAFVSALAERRVLVAPGVAFGAPDFFRVCITAGERAIDCAMEVAGELAAVEELSA